jgi:signal transduction histidine kinase
LPVSLLIRVVYVLFNLSMRFIWWCLTPLRRAMRPLTTTAWWKRHARSNVNRLRLRSVPLRRWLVLALAALVFVPIIAGAITAIIVYTGSHQESSDANEILIEGAGNWTDPEWQSKATEALRANGIEVILFEDGREVFRSTADPLSGNDYPGGMRQISVGGPGSDQTAIIYGDPLTPFGEDRDEDWPVPAVTVSALILTFIGMAIFFGRSVVKPLAAASAAASDIAGGNLKISLPGSRVREVAELNAAFEGMATELSESLAHEASLEQQRRLFVGAVAHDLRTPLFSLRGSLEAIQTGIADTDEKREKYLATAQEKADALDRLVSDLFDFTRLEFLDQEPKREVLQIGPLVQRTVDAFRPRAEEKQIGLSFSDRTAGCTVLGDAHLLTRAIDNLVDNAIRFTPEGGAAQVECLRDDIGVIISVSDSGPGIPQEDLPHIFEALYRGESSRNRRTGGAGLGLTIARNVFLAHGGDLKARNGSPHGAIFIATLPGAD